MSLEEEELGFEPVFTHRNHPYPTNQIRYTQDSIGTAFKNGKTLELSLHLLKIGMFIYTINMGLKICYLTISIGDLKLTSFPNIKVFVRDKKVYSLDNRRLWLFKQFAKEITIDIIRYDPRFEEKITTTSGIYML